MGKGISSTVNYSKYSVYYILSALLIANYASKKELLTSFLTFI